MGEERLKILHEIYPSKIKKGAQRKHIEGTHEFEQKRQSMQKDDLLNEPSKLNKNVDPQALVDKYKGTGEIKKLPNAKYPTEIVQADKIIGQAWVKSLQKYIDTDVFRIAYSGEGTHVVPLNPGKARKELS